jgi:uncharacterized protein (UPF0276 family)
MKAQPPRVGLNLNPEGGFLAAAAPLFEEGLVAAVEIDIDHRWLQGHATRQTPRWLAEILDIYAADDALYGHGVWLSVASGRWEPRQERWLRRLAAECRRRRYRHVSEHFGFFTAGEFSQSTMWPVPRTPGVVRVAVDKLRRMRGACGGAPVGLENFAAVLCRRDALDQGPLLAEILEQADGFLLLDLHNIYCQAVNLDLDPLELLRTYPLQRARELHIAGGNDWTSPAGELVHLDSHDHPVPEGTWAMVPEALRLCSNLDVVLFERRGETLYQEADQIRYREDFRRLRALVEAAHVDQAA